MRIREEMDNSNNTLYNRKGNAVVADSIRCITCRNIPKQCLETPCCSSVVCGDCSKLLRFCPNCSEVFTTELKVNLPLQRIIDTMAAFCEVCEQSNSHADSCPRKQVSCPYLCGQSIPVVDVESHVKECDFVEVACPNSCGSSIRKKDLEKHTATDCWIPCKYARYGCSFNGTIPMLQEHNKNDCHSHLEMLMNTVDRQNTEIQQLQQQRIEIPCHAVINRFRTAYGPTLRMAANQITPRELKTFAFFMILFMSLPKFFAAIALGIIPLMLISAFQQNDQPKILKTGSALLAGVLYAILPWFLCILLVAFSLCSTTVPGRRWFAMISHFVNRL